MAAVRVERRADGVAFLTLARPEVHNALDGAMAAELTDALEALRCDAAVRAVVLSGEGKSFCAGADLDWMTRAAALDAADNLADAQALADLMHKLNTLPKPTLTRIHGAAFGGAVGLAACCDIAVAADDAVFSLSEVRLGLIPAVIAPYVIAAIGGRAARRWFLTGERFTAAEALRAGLVHQVVVAEQLNNAVEAFLARLGEGAPAAQAEAKALISAVAGRPVTSELVGDTARRIAELRAGPEALEGIAAFREKRPPAWRR